ncbi:MAG: hypothetical protein CMB80_05480 [Flammeovirgaceae bacterium]|nr:hypothetical protein [Flammeovirgaceae bacterium]|tara:strand:+ start:4051 stop:4413 length:363 start_codon:yes stop_codon:yes gene_type:complete
MSFYFSGYGTVVETEEVTDVPAWENGAKLFNIVVQPVGAPGKTFLPIKLSQRIAPDRMSGGFAVPPDGAKVTVSGVLYGGKGHTQRFLNAQIRSLTRSDEEEGEAPAQDTASEQDDDIDI